MTGAHDPTCGQDAVFLSNCWQVAAYSSEIEHRLFKRRLVGRSVLLYRTGAGEVVAMEDRCPHRYVPLSLGRLDGDIVQCGYHGMRFDATGRCVGIPGQKIVPAKARVPVFPTVERYTFVWIWMGDPYKADPALVPDFHWMHHAEWAVAEGYHHVAANYRFLIDNLLDLSHETFVHPETIGNEAVAESPVAVSIVDKKTVRAHRDMASAEAPPQFVSLAGFSGRIDRWHTTFYTPPGFCVIEVGAVPAGTADRASGFEARILNLITPENERSSHYFWAHARNIRLDDDALTGVIRQSIVETFDQDKTVLEAQQIESAAVGSMDPGVILGIDTGPVQGRRVLHAALQAEQTAPQREEAR
ncbi:MAG: aromatic ring-hydroxylating dioxygenase subunit alpha [Sphingomonadaceae bacterium]|nr:aromatic ring-hydroxylating dioxygenase subunit alpha [Sphingomonadaceae bacterium]